MCTHNVYGYSYQYTETFIILYYKYPDTTTLLLQHLRPFPDTASEPDIGDDSVKSKKESRSANQNSDEKYEGIENQEQLEQLVSLTEIFVCGLRISRNSHVLTSTIFRPTVRMHGGLLSIMFCLYVT